MHILILPSEYFITKESPTAGIFQFDQAKIFIKKGNKVGVIAVKPYYTLRELSREVLLVLRTRSGIKRLIQRIMYFFFPTPFAFKKDQKQAINIIRFEGSYGLTRTEDSEGRLAQWNRMGDFAFFKYVKKFGRPDVMHAHNIVYAGMMGNYLSQKHNIPIVLTERSSEHVMKDLPDVLKRMISKHLNLMRNLNAVSPSLIEQLEARYSFQKGKMKWLPNVIDKIFEKENASKNGEHGSFVFLNVANLIPLKGQIELIKAFAKTFATSDNVILKIAGRGNLRAELEREIRELNLGEKVKLTGFLSREQVLSEMRMCDVCILPSHYETFGVVLIEALALGKPVIASKCGGPECIVKESNGLLFENKDIDDLARVMLKMKNNISKYNSDKIREDLLREFGEEVFYKRVIGIYQSAINDNNN